MTTLYFTTVPTPAGEFSLAVDESGAIVATAFGDRATLASRVRAIAPFEFVAGKEQTRAARREVEAYFDGTLTRFSLPLAPHGSTFQKRVWRELTRVEFGETCTYGDLARRLGSFPRAIGQANAANPICLIVPCHRVIGSGGALTGYAFGADRKRVLLEHESGKAIRAA